MKRPAAWIFALLAISLAAPALAQDRYPTRPIRLVIPSVPAGVHDVIGRVWAERVKPQLGTIVDRQSRRRRRPDRRQRRRAFAARRLQHPARQHVDACPAHAGHGQPALRSGQGFLGRRRVRLQLDLDRDQSRAAGAHAPGTHRLRQGQSGQAVLWFGRQRLDHQSRGRAVQVARGRPRHRARAVQGHRPGRDRSDRRADPDVLGQRHRANSRSPSRRQGPHPVGECANAHPERTRHPHLDRSGIA